MDWSRFAHQMATMARDLLAQETMEATLERITASATELVDGCDAAVHRRGGPRRAEPLLPQARRVS
ncbi:hypothetical protein [Streptomyces humi]|uniref:hypothetical protein n=1 Tax=Streptomyces humi TaxID=1428620 RepID=UPI003B846189